MPDIPIDTLLLLGLAVIGLITVFTAFTLPQSFAKNQKKKEELRVILERNKELQQL
jgi:hypothetical protein